MELVQNENFEVLLHLYDSDLPVEEKREVAIEDGKKYRLGGTDLYTNAISDIYQDNFDEGIFTGKGIYDLEIFHKKAKELQIEDLLKQMF